MNIINSRLNFLIKLFREHFKLPLEIVNMIIYKYNGLATASAVAWHTDTLLHLQLLVHKTLIQKRGARASESRCWCAGFNLGKVLCEAHAFGTSQQVPLTKYTVRHTTAPLYPITHITYRYRCSQASLLTRVACVLFQPDRDRELQINPLPSVDDRIWHNASMPFIPITIQSQIGTIYAWFIRTYKNVPIALQNDTDALIYAYYKGC